MQNLSTRNSSHPGPNAIETAVTGLGYELVDVEKGVGGLLRVFIDHPAAAGGRAITVDDCEKVTRQLQHVLEVEAYPYERLEVSSPGLYRPLRRTADYERFVGAQVDLTLKEPFRGRKRYRGELQAAGDRWRLLLPPPEGVPKAKAAKGGAKAAAVQVEPAVPAGTEAGLALDFSLEEVREARLVPALDFKGRRFAPRAADPQADGADNDADGGRIQ